MDGGDGFVEFGGIEVIIVWKLGYDRLRAELPAAHLACFEAWYAAES